MSNTLEVTLMGKEYRVACEASERDALLAAVSFLDGRLKEIGDKTGGSGERRAVMAALNLAHELLTAKQTFAHVVTAVETKTIQRRIDCIEAKLDESLAQHGQLF